MTFAFPGWDVSVEAGRLVARRRAALTPYQRANGAVDEVSAGGDGELWLLCDAQRRLAERLMVAEMVAGRRVG